MARKSFDPALPVDSGPETSVQRGAPVFAVVSDPSFFERVRTDCERMPKDIDFYDSLPKLLTRLESDEQKIDLAFVLLVEHSGREIDVTSLRQLRLDFPQVVPVAVLETCEKQSELRLQSVGVNSILLPPFDEVDVSSAIAMATPNVPTFKRHPDLMRRGRVRLDFLIPSDLSYVLGINYEISLLLKEFGFPLQDSRINIPLACDEAITNAIIHGNESKPNKKVNVHIYLSSSRFRIRVRDQGKGFEAESVADPREGNNVHRGSGRGVFLMRKIMDSVEYKDGGCVVELEKLNPNASQENNGSR